MEEKSSTLPKIWRNFWLNPPPPLLPVSPPPSSEASKPTHPPEEARSSPPPPRPLKLRPSPTYVHNFFFC